VTASAAAGTGGYVSGCRHQGEPGIAGLTRPEIASMPPFGSMR
jgi:hypothetical protein